MIEYVKQWWGKAVCHLLNPIMVPGGNIVDIRGRPEPLEIISIIRVASHPRRWGRLQSKVCHTRQTAGRLHVVEPTLFLPKP